MSENKRREVRNDELSIESQQDEIVQRIDEHYVVHENDEKENDDVAVNDDENDSINDEDDADHDFFDDYRRLQWFVTPAVVRRTPTVVRRTPDVARNTSIGPNSRYERLVREIKKLE